MTSNSDSLDDLLVLARRGSLSEGEQRRLREALAADPEARLLYRAGRAFDDEAPIEAGDDARIERFAKAVEQARAPRRRASLWPVVRAALAGALAASLAIAAVQQVERRFKHAPPAAPPSPRSQVEPPHAPTPTQQASPVATPPVAELDTPAPSAVPMLPLDKPGAPLVPGPAHESTSAPTPPAALAPSTPAVAGFPDLPARAEAGSASELFSAANRARAGGDLARAVTLYQRLQATFPASSEAIASEVTLGMILLQEGNASSALTAFRSYLAHGGGATRAEALWGQAQALRQLGRSAEERAALDELLQRYPSSAYGAAARKRLAELH